MALIKVTAPTFIAASCVMVRSAVIASPKLANASFALGTTSSFHLAASDQLPSAFAFQRRVVEAPNMSTGRNMAGALGALPSKLAPAQNVYPSGSVGFLTKNCCLVLSQRGVNSRYIVLLLLFVSPTTYQVAAAYHFVPGA